MITFQIAWPSAGDVSFKFLPYQLSMVRYWFTMVVTGNRQSGFDSRREPEKHLPHLRKAGGTKITQSQHREVVTRKNGTLS